ncbi:hypothetical protein COV17_03625 [Candidatus Woesearchaeota archaeon CG10_big_fil_rev_8_21_14_0_10_36_11]|nr:MAG: hypothetical protein COV17_03625 [Candidatus Woesearchaeota archaeon CG10_big_fil_rev_8_21_14_0_10_36_11]
MTNRKIIGATTAVATTIDAASAHHIEKLLALDAVIQRPKSLEDVRFMGDSLIASFGLNMDNPTLPPDIDKGYATAVSFLERICSVFEDPTHVIRMAPFAHAYLGTQGFNDALDVILDRAEKFPNEQPMLDTIFPATALVQPSSREEFLLSVLGYAAGELEGDELLGLGFLISDANPNVTFTDPGEFPSEFPTSDVRDAAHRIGTFLESGFFIPGVGFTDVYKTFKEKMGGDIEYMFKEPLPEHIVVVSPSEEKFTFLQDDNTVEWTPSYDARPNTTHENPTIVIVNDIVPLDAVRCVYRNSTIVYVAGNKLARDAMMSELGPSAQELLIDTTVVNDKGAKNRVANHLRYIRTRRDNSGLVDFRDMLNADINVAEDFVARGNEHFFDFRSSFEELGREGRIDAMVEEKGYTVPIKTNNDLVMLLSHTERDLNPFFENVTPKTVRAYSGIPDITKTGMPFAILTNMSVPHADIIAAYPSATVLYVARDDSEETRIMKANPNGDIFVVNTQSVERVAGGGRNRAGYAIVEMFFEQIAAGRTEGVTVMSAITKRISAGIKKERDDILFKESLPGFAGTAASYWRLQEKYRATPLVAQLTDGVLMETCPTGGCFKLNQPEQGGCCGGGNLPGVLIDFAIAYRKQVGDEKFIAELQTFHGGNRTAPWYLDTREYKRVFPGGIEPKKKGRFTF